MRLTTQKNDTKFEKQKITITQWEAVSESAKSMITAMLVHEEGQRSTAAALTKVCMWVGLPLVVVCCVVWVEVEGHDDGAWRCVSVI